jgi:hypothetical protein
MTHEGIPGIDGTRTMRRQKEFGFLMYVAFMFTVATGGYRMHERCLGMGLDRKKPHSLKLADSTPLMR